MHKTIWMTPLFAFLVSCSTVSSSYHYTLGTEAAQQGDYQGALVHLQQAVDLDPTIARNHNNLACVYLDLGEPEKAWQPACNAVWTLADAEDTRAFRQNFVNIWNRMREQHQIKKGLTVDEVMQRLGQPNSINSLQNHNGWVLTYGLVMLRFENNVLDRGTLIGTSKDGVDCL